MPERGWEQGEDSISGGLAHGDDDHRPYRWGTSAILRSWTSREPGEGIAYHSIVNSFYHIGISESDLLKPICVVGITTAAITQSQQSNTMLRLCCQLCSVSVPAPPSPLRLLRCFYLTNTITCPELTLHTSIPIVSDITNLKSSCITKIVPIIDSLYFFFFFSCVVLYFKLCQG